MHPARRRLGFLSAAITALAAALAVILPALSMSAATSSAVGTRVGASHPGMILPVGVDHLASAGERRCEPVPQPRIVSGACVAAEDTGDLADTATTVRRFVRQDEFNAIQKALGSGDSEVQVGRYFTPDNITSPRAAAEQLALPGTDTNPLVGYFDVPRSSLPSEPLATFGPRLVNPDFYQPGAGLEIEVSELYGRPFVPTADLRLVGF